MSPTVGRPYTNLLLLGIGLAALGTVLALYVFARKEFFALRPLPRVAYVEALPQVHTGVEYTIDGVNTGTSETPLQKGKLQFSASFARPFAIRGWAIDSVAHAPLVGVVVRSDFDRPFGAVYGTSRPDVAAARCGPACTKTGFVIDFEARSVPVGVHRLWFSAVTADGSALYVAPQPVVFAVHR